MVVCTSMGTAVSSAVAVGYADTKVDKFLNKVVDFALETSIGQSFLRWFERKHQKEELERWLPYTKCYGGRKKQCRTWETKQAYFDHLERRNLEQLALDEKEARGEKDCSKEKKWRRTSEADMKRKCQERNAKNKQLHEESKKREESTRVHGYVKEDCSMLSGRAKWQCNRRNNGKRREVLKQGEAEENCNKEYSYSQRAKKNCRMRNRERAERLSIATKGYAVWIAASGPILLLRCGQLSAADSVRNAKISIGRQTYDREKENDKGFQEKTILLSKR